MRTFIFVKEEVTVREEKKKNKRKRNDFDDVFKSLKTNHTKLFISIINESFGTHYTQADKAVLLPTEGTHLTKDSRSRIIRKYSDFLLKIGGKTYLIECQSYADGTMAIRIAEYARGTSQTRMLAFSVGDARDNERSEWLSLRQKIMLLWRAEDC